MHRTSQKVHGLAVGRQKEAVAVNLILQSQLASPVVKDVILVFEGMDDCAQGVMDAGK